MVAAPGKIDANFFGEGARSPDRGGSTPGEEFFAYGRSSDRRDARARYRYIGVERDEETGLCMTGPRTYDPIVGRFLQGDPLIQGGSSPFAYSRGNPIRMLDKNGYNEFPAEITPKYEGQQCTIENPQGVPQATGPPLPDGPAWVNPRPDPPPAPTLPSAWDNLMSWAAEHVPDVSPAGAVMRTLPILGVKGHTDPNHDAAFFATALNLSAGMLPLAEGAGPAAAGATTPRAIAGGIRVTEQGIARVEAHLKALDALGEPQNAAMLARLKAGETTAQDINFYMHELKESSLLSRIPGEGYDAARAAHLQTLEWQGIEYAPGYESRLYHPDVISAYPEHFNPAAWPK